MVSPKHETREKEGEGEIKAKKWCLRAKIERKKTKPRRGDRKLFLHRGQRATMEVACSVPSLRSVRNIHRISVWNSAQLALLTYREQEELRNIMDGLGKLSAQAQHLRSPITDYGRLKTGSHTLYLCTTGVQGKPEFVLAKGMLKVGRKNLYIRKDNGQLVEMSPLCVLDFYVHESCQRMGLGHELFEAMLGREKTSSRELGYDRPSSKFHSFLAKYYNLTEYLPQPNQYVVFKDYFNEQTSGNGGCALEDWGRHSPQASYLDSSCKKDKVLHGRRTSISEIPAIDGEYLPVRKLEPDVEGSNDIAVTDRRLNQKQLCGRRQSRHHMPNSSVVDKVLCPSDSCEPQGHLSSHSSSPATSERDSFRAKNTAAEDYKPSIYGRRSVLSKPSDARKRSDKACVRYPSPPSLPKSLEGEPNEEKPINPLKFPRTESTQARLFHEDSFFEKRTKPRATIKCPFWTDEANAFDRKGFDSLDKFNVFTPVPVTFEDTRSCYHAGMRGYGAAEAMGWSHSLIK